MIARVGFGEIGRGRRGKSMRERDEGNELQREGHKLNGKNGTGRGIGEGQ